MESNLHCKRVLVAIARTELIKPGQTCKIVVKPNLDFFRVGQLFIDPVSAPYFEVGNFWVGNGKQELVGPLPASIFAPYYANTKQFVEHYNAPTFIFNTCLKTAEIKFDIKNLSDQERVFGGGAFGGEALI